MRLPSTSSIWTIKIKKSRTFGYPRIKLVNLLEPTDAMVVSLVGPTNSWLGYLGVYLGAMTGYARRGIGVDGFFFVW